MNAFREADGPYLQSRAGRNLSSCDTQDPDRNEGQLHWELRSVCVLYAAAVTGSTPQ